MMRPRVLCQKRLSPSELISRLARKALGLCRQKTNISAGLLAPWHWTCTSIKITPFYEPTVRAVPAVAELIPGTRRHPMAHALDPRAAAPARSLQLAHGPIYQAYIVLYIGFVVLPILAGLDKFFHVL